MRAFLLIVGIFLINGVHAQLSNAEFAGKIKNQKGQAIAAAQIKLVYTATAIRYNLSTDNKGTFKANNIEVGGPYLLRVEVPGYRVYEKRQVYFDLGYNDDMNIVLEEYKEEGTPGSNK